MTWRRPIPIRQCDTCRAWVAGPTRTHRPHCHPAHTTRSAR